MKRAISILLLACLLFCAVAGFAEDSQEAIIDISSLGVEELKELKTAINERLIELGELYEEIDKKSSGENVLLLQKRLIELGYLAEATGNWDKASQNAMRDYEKVIGVKKPNGVASIEEQEQIFSATAMAKPTPEPTATPRPTATPDPRKEYGKFDYSKVARNPENYINTKVRLEGRVLQALGSRSEGYDVRLATKGRYDNVVYLVIPSTVDLSSNILEGDKLTAYATLYGDYTYETVLGAEVTLPLAMGDMITIK